MKQTLPQTFSELVEEIVRFSGITRRSAEYGIWMEALEPGWNVAREAANYQVTPHHYDGGMEKLYLDGTGFIFETLVFWARPWRRAWTPIASERLKRHSDTQEVQPSGLKILMLGDGTGSDSLFLAGQGFNVDYYDIPGSRTWDFAMKRFEYYGVLGTRIHIVSQYDDCLLQQYDAVLSFEVLEHLAKPLDAISGIYRMLKPGGIALVTESFGLVSPKLPTHLLSNVKYAGRAPFLFLKEHLCLSWYNKNPLFKPMEFVKIEKGAFGGYRRLLGDWSVLRPWLALRKCDLKRTARGRFTAWFSGADRSLL